MHVPTELFLIDDYQPLTDVLADALGGEGFGVTTFADGRRALDALASGARPAVAVLDWCMPGMSGAEFVRELERRAWPLRIVVLSGAKVACEASTVVGAVLSKPCPVPTLVAAVRRTIGGGEHGRGLRAGPGVVRCARVASARAPVPALAG